MPTVYLVMRRCIAKDEFITAKATEEEAKKHAELDSGYYYTRANIKVDLADEE